MLALPIVFAAGMSPVDTADGLFFDRGLRLGVRPPGPQDLLQPGHHRPIGPIALLIGSIEVVSVLHDKLGWVNPATDWISALSLNNVGFTVVGLFIATWACAIAYWRLTDAERRWQTAPSGETAD